MDIVEKKLPSLPSPSACRKQPLPAVFGKENAEINVGGFESDGNPEKMVSKWSREEIKKWLSFIVRQAVDSPYRDLEYELIESSHTERIYRILSNLIGAKNPRQC
jgi:hypothetical protein